MRLSGLAWLSIVIGCGGSSATPGVESTGAPGSSSTSATETSGASSSSTVGDSSTTTITSDTTTLDTSTSSGSSSGSSSTESGSGESSSESSSSSGGEPHAACTDGCAVEFMCGTQWDSADACSQWCEDNLDKAAEFSPFCADTWEALSACFGTLDCEQFAEYQAAKVFPYPCSMEADALAFECAGQ